MQAVELILITGTLPHTHTHSPRGKKHVSLNS